MAARKIGNPIGLPLQFMRIGVLGIFNFVWLRLRRTVRSVVSPLTLSRNHDFWNFSSPLSFILTTTFLG